MAPQTIARPELCLGMTVLCTTNNIDKQLGSGRTGKIEGFARLSAYHPREVYVSFPKNPEANGWFWESGIMAAE